MFLSVRFYRKWTKRKLVIMEEAFQGTVVGLNYEEGTTLASDSRTTARNLVRSKKVQKIYKIQDNIAAGISGLGGDAKSLVDNMKTESNLYRMRKDKQIPTNSLARLTSNIFHQRKMMPYIVSMILAGYDSDGPRLFFLDPAGGNLEEEKFASAGTGSSVAYGVLEQKYELGMEKEEALELATQSIQQAIERDAATGDKISVVNIDSDGFQKLSDDRIKDFRQ